MNAPAPNHSPIFCALDTPDVAKAQTIAQDLHGRIAGLKVGLEYFTANGISGYKAIHDLGMPIFLDLKLHDIPNTVAGAVSSLLPLKPAFMTLHTSGGGAMMRAAADAAAQAGAARPKLLGVTVLTSLDSADMADVGQCENVGEQVARLALLAQKSGLDGVICSPAEVANLRRLCGPDFILMVPGIRPAWAAANDQKRIMTPREAMDAGATYLVIGRPITGAANPGDAAGRVNDEIMAS